MSKGTINLVGTLMTAATDMNLKAGMRVVVVNGVILSIYSGDTAVPLAVDERMKRTITPPKEPKPLVWRNTQADKRKKAGVKSYMKMDGSPLDSLKVIINTIRAMCEKEDKVQVSDVLAAMQIDPKDKGRWKVTASIAWLQEQSMIAVSGKRSDRVITWIAPDADPIT